MRRAQVVGIGMVGGSVAAGLRKRGWHVTGSDLNTDRLADAVAQQIIDVAGVDDEAEITFIATPVSTIAACAQEALARGGIVTDVGSVKGTVTAAVTHPKFVAGHPMAGSERSGLEGVNADLFVGATWVLTPDDHTDPEAYGAVREVVGLLGADIVALNAAEHDTIVATISHVPHLAASALMSVAMQRSTAHEEMLRLAAGGFRDMTRIAAGHPGLWADISLENRDAIADGLARLVASLEELREYIVNGRHEPLEKVLNEAAVARIALPLRPGQPSNMSLLRVPIPDQPGAIGEVVATLGMLNVNIEDLQIAHDPKGDRGVLEIAIAKDAADRAKTSLEEKGFRSAVENL